MGALAVPATAGTTPTATPAAPRGTPHVIHLPAPVREVDPLTNVNFNLRPDRLRKSSVPGPTSDREDVVVAVGPTGTAQTVTDTQHLVIHGAGNYIVRELGPARAAVGLGDTVPPVLELGTVVWQGFSPGTRSLAARLTLDAGIESARLPLRVSFAFRDKAGHQQGLRPGAEAPTAGSVVVTLVNQTSSQRVVDSGRADLQPLVRALEMLQASAAHPRAAVPPVAGAGLPRTVPGTSTGQRQLDVVAPLRVTGTITVPGAAPQITGPGLTPTTGGASVDGTLAGSVSFTVPVQTGQRVALHLDVRPWPDARTLAPPKPFRSWRAWAASGPDDAAVAQATDTLIAGAAAAAHAAEYSPYLQADMPGPDLSTFTYVVATKTATQRAGDDLTPRPGAIALTVVAVLAVAGNAALLRRRL